MTFLQLFIIFYLSNLITAFKKGIFGVSFSLSIRVHVHRFLINFIYEEILKSSLLVVCEKKNFIAF